MSVPNFQNFMLPILKITADNNEHKSRDIVNQAADLLGLSQADKQQRLPSQTQPTYYNRAMWARSYLLKAGLLESPVRGTVKITQRGLDLLKTNLDTITRKTLLQYDDFKEFQNTVNSEQNSKELEEEPRELIAKACEEITSHLESALLSRITQNSSTFFEELVAELLVAMGYGGSKNDILQNRGKSGDGGIDGIIKQDSLGLDKLYIQAKKWDEKNVVSRPEIHKFVGALLGQHANRGVFITTSSFTKGARDYVGAINSSIILIDGKMLTELMIKYNVGVQVEDTIQIKKIDEDRFEED